jgi:hypothetical protein
LGSKAENTAAGAEKSIKPGFMYANVWGTFGAWTPFLTYNDGKVSAESAGTTTDAKSTYTELGVANVTDIDPVNKFFWSVSYVMLSEDTGAAGSTKTDSTMLPLTIGVEAEAASWLTLRGSVKQSVLISTVKATETDSHPKNETTVAAGVGLKLNKFMLDGALENLVSEGAEGTANANAGKLNANALLSTVSLTYNF